MRYISILPIIILMSSLLACTPSKKSAAGFHLPDGDAERGKAAFVALKCHECHQVAGVELPSSTIPVPVALGGIVFYPKTDGQLITAIVDPARRVGPGLVKDAIRVSTLSHMSQSSAEMTLRQLIDVVTFLHSAYDVRPPIGAYQF